MNQPTCLDCTHRMVCAYWKHAMEIDLDCIHHDGSCDVERRKLFAQATALGCSQFVDAKVGAAISP